MSKGQITQVSANAIGILRGAKGRCIFTITCDISLGLLARGVFVCGRKILKRVKGNTNCSARGLSCIVITYNGLRTLATRSMTQSCRCKVARQVYHQRDLICNGRNVSLESLGITMFRCLVGALSILYNIGIININARGHSSRIIGHFYRLCDNLATRLGCYTIKFFHLSCVNGMFKDRELGVGLVKGIRVN